MAGGDRTRVCAVLTFAAAVAAPSGLGSPDAMAQLLGNFGPYNAIFLSGGVGLSRPLPAATKIVDSDANWSVTGWIRVDRTDGGPLVVVAIGDSGRSDCRCLLTDRGVPILQLGRESDVRGNVALARGTWHFVGATYGGRMARLYVDGAEIAAREVASSRVAPEVRLAPDSIDDPAGAHHFGGAVASLQIHERALEAVEIADLAATPPNFALVTFHRVGVGWPWQEHAWRGLLEPQPAWTLPRGHAMTPKPAISSVAVAPALQPVDSRRWSLGGWRLAYASSVAAPAERVSTPGYTDGRWIPAQVPGTVLTTLIANGVYPDPDYGLNNLAIPESLNREDYWYRTEFPGMATLAGKRVTLTFNGINYEAEVWLNGTRLGTIRGAFIRGEFDVSSLLRADAPNALAVRIAPPPHPGIPHEQSVAAGPGENGGNLAIDGPTFIATEGWDWIPAIRDRDTGIWQGVDMSVGGSLRLLDPQIVTRLPLPKTDSADIEIDVPVENCATNAVSATVVAAFEGVRVEQTAVIDPGTRTFHFDSRTHPQLHLRRPRLWWPNGYGEPALYELAVSALVRGSESDHRRVQFGVREVSYELSLFDSEGRLHRVEVDPAAQDPPRPALVDIRHEATKRTATGWAESLTGVAEGSPAVREINSTSLTPYLALRVNGVPIAVRGGNWGMDDSRKRVERSRLEPYFALHRAAHLNTIRNWLGQNTEETFYDLADRYGLLVLNDFWVSTQDFQVEPDDTQLFLENAADVIRRFRNHPSIAMWIGRNEGMPAPFLNESLAKLVTSLDGTRYYTGSSNRINLQDSGPYDWRPPEQYFDSLASGFAVEVGTPSPASLETLRETIPAADLWPLGDTYAYHDWHFGGNGDTASFVKALATRFGAATGLEDFERKAQMMSYEAHRAIFEGFQAHLWTRNSGRMLWMSHPAWPSNTWQIYTADYDAPAAFYAVASACEPLHVQLDLPDYNVSVVNTTRSDERALLVRSRVVSLDDRLLEERTDHVSLSANSVVRLPPLSLARLLDTERMVLVELTLTDSRKGIASRNVYWQGRTDGDLRRLLQVPPVHLAVSAASTPERDGDSVMIRMTNHDTAPALLARLTLQDSRGERVLPAYYSNNYLTLLPGESTSVAAHCPAQGRVCARVALRGWNVVNESFAVAHGRRAKTDSESSR